MRQYSVRVVDGLSSQGGDPWPDMEEKMIEAIDAEAALDEVEAEIDARPLYASSYGVTKGEEITVTAMVFYDGTRTERVLNYQAV